MKEDYPLFVKWFEATDWILDTVEKFPKSVRFTVSGRIANMALDVMEGIIEAIYTKPGVYIGKDQPIYRETKGHVQVELQEKIPLQAAIRIRE
jgi:hypothetical protein